MTDSMKFGPEWLRNMSADSTVSNSVNSSSQFTNSTAVGFGGGGSVMTPSNSTNNSNTSLTTSNSNINANSLHNSVNMSSSGASRNTFPEFRYGREEMLLLFDRNCNIPEILPSYKNLFIEKVQFPIALVPSTDEEMIMQGSVPPTRPAWLQRSPVGFSTSTRGIGRGGSMERGRMRGKSVYHPVFQRPNAMFEEDIRPATIKADRSWAERNGGVGGDAVISAGQSAVGSLGSESWNGNTPSSSPRREFSNHPRNMENWRRSRNEEGAGDGSAATTFSADGGWRMNSSGLQNTHTRWGRSTSWRDDELANNNETQGIGTSASGTPFQAGGMMMQRSYSTISTSHGEHAGHQNVTKQATGHTAGGSGGGPIRSVSMTSSAARQSVGRNMWPSNVQTNTMSSSNQGECANDDTSVGSGGGGPTRPISLTARQSVCRNIWPNNVQTNTMSNSNQGEGANDDTSVGSGGGGPTRPVSMTARQSVCRNIWPNNIQTNTMSNNNQGEGANDDIALPEWAMENPSDVGGTFDASGAFRGTLDDDDDVDDNHDQQESSLRSESLEDNVVDKGEHHQKSIKTSEDCLNRSSDEIFKSNTEISMNSSSPSPPSSSAVTLDHENSNDNSGDCDKSLQDNISDLKESLTSYKIQENVSKINNNHNDSSKDESTGDNVKTFMDMATLSNNNSGDYAERMMRVADDMIEKLIMDDEAKDEHMKSPSLITAVGNKINAQHAFVNALQMQKQQQNSNLQTVSPAQAVSAGSTGPPNMGMPSLYNMAGMIGDHTHNMAALHQLQQQQMSAVAIGLQPPPHPLASTSAADLWLYRDPQAKVQGPFSAVEMTEWYRAGYFNENLFVRRVCDSRYRPLGELIKICNGQMPFNHSHLIPIDISPSPLTPPLPPNMSSVQPLAQTADFIIKTLSEHQQHQQHEELKGNVTAAADSLSNALKSLINSVDMSQVLNMHFQTLQERFIRNQEMEIINELSKNECFQRLSAAEQDTVVRQKLQMMVLPEYLTNLTGLSNSLAALNPAAQTQLYDTIAECSKKEQLYASNQQQPTQSQQQRSNHHSTSSATYANAEDFIMKNSKSGNHDLVNNDLLNEFNLRMFLNNNSDISAAASVATSNSHANEFLNEQQLFGASVATTSNPLINSTGQSPMMKMWMTQISGNQSNHHQQVQPQTQLMTGQQHGVNDQWLNGSLVGIPAIGIAREQLSSAGGDGVGGVIGSPKPIPTSMWDVATLEQHVQVQQLQQQQQQQVHLKQQDQQQQQQLQHQLQQQQLHQEQHLNFEHNHHINETLESSHHHQDVNKQNNRHQMESKDEQHQQQQQMQQKTNESQKQTDPKFLSNDVINKQEMQSQHQSSNEKLASQLINNKRNGNSNTVKQTTKPTTTKDDNVVANITNSNKKIEDERRREQNEEKRRQKEERKRQQIEEEKRRHLQAEEEKRRQFQEEEKRQQQIQAQRRKALMSISNNNSPNADIGLLQPNSTFSHLPGNNAVTGNKSNNKDQQRIQASVAPWSSQTMSAAKSQGPSLAEIQKAERRERRADQQRQLEMQEKQMRALAATAEAQDPVLKWNAAPVPVKSFAEIQAEEAKRLAHEQMESQRRKEQDASASVNFSSGVATTPGSGIMSTSNMSSIWSGTKIWGATANATGFWEEPQKFNNKTQSGGGAASSSSNGNSATSSASSFLQSKLSPLQQNSTQQSASNKNIKKSQSVTVMQNAVSITPSSSGTASASNQKKAINSTTIATKQTKPQRTQDTYSVADNKKLGAKNNSNTNKCDDYEAEFINWCTKSLNNMNAKVDVPTFVSFLRDLESPYEVKDYIRMYLGESKEYIDFAKQFLERRSKYKNLQRAQNAHNDDLCKPAQAITPSANDSSENKSKQKKIKKNKMTKLDARVLGFSVTAAEGRINVGDRDYVDAP